MTYPSHSYVHASMHRGKHAVSMRLIDRLFVSYAATLRPEVPCYFFIDQAQDHASSIQTALAAQRKKAFNCLFVFARFEPDRQRDQEGRE